jgi:hypothetical protein
MTTSSSVPDNGGDHSGGGGEPEGTYTDDVFSTYLYDGRNGPFRIRNGVDLDGEGGLVWIKCRNQSVTHQLVDTERGQSSYLASQSGNQEIIDADSRVTYFNNDGFSLGTGGEVNNATRTYASWTFGKAKKFFDIVTYTGDGVAGREILHNLGVKPGMVIVKKTNAPSDWPVWHRDLGEANSGSTHSLTLNDSNSQAGRAEFATTQTATHIVIGSTPGGINANGDEYVAYLFAHDETDSGQIQCGVYTGTGADQDIELGWEPQLVMIKSANASGNWELFDCMRGISTSNAYTLRPNSDQIESDYAGGSLTLNPNGFSVNVDFGVSGREYIYMAIRKPNKPRPPVGYYVDDVFSTYLYEGDQSSSSRAIVNGIDLDGEGGMVWIKERSRDRPHYLYDTERGAGTHLETNRNQPESPVSNQNLNSFNSDGFTLGDFYGISETGEDFTSWTFRKARSFFDVVTYTGNGVQNRAVPHGLGCTPGMVIIKSVSVSRDWHVWHNSFPEWTGGTTEGDISGSNDVGRLQLSNDTAFLSGYGGFTYANDTAFGLYRSNLDENVVGEEYVAYVFAHDDSDEGMIQCGSYAATLTTPLNVSLGWEPQWVLIKAAEGTGDWLLFDAFRGIVTGGDDRYLVANSSAAEAGGANFLSVNPDGFSIDLVNAGINGGTAGDEYIYMAIRRPNKPAEEFEPEELFNTVQGESTITTPSFNLGLSPDMAWEVNPSAGSENYIGSRLQGAEHMFANNSSAAVPNTNITWDHMNGWVEGFNGSSDYNAWGFKRAPGFFDVVTYEGDGQAGREVAHNLGVAPEMMWVRRRTNSNWAVYVSEVGATKSLWLDLPNEAQDSPDTWNSTSPSDTSFTLGTYVSVNTGGTSHIAYLFASVPGICDIGTYTGNGGSATEIDCGFTNGARFVLIKRTDDASDWMYFDTLRGITDNDSPKLALNNTEKSRAGARISPASVGFKTRSSEVSVAGGTYIYMAIA